MERTLGLRVRNAREGLHAIAAGSHEHRNRNPTEIGSITKGSLTRTDRVRSRVCVPPRARGMSPRRGRLPGSDWNARTATESRRDKRTHLPRQSERWKCGEWNARSRRQRTTGSGTGGGTDGSCRGRTPSLEEWNRKTETYRTFKESRTDSGTGTHQK